MEMSAVAENACMGEPPPNPLGGDNGVGRGQELLLWRRPCTSRSHPLEELYNPDGGLEVPGCWDRCDKEEGKEEQSSPTFYFQWRACGCIIWLTTLDSFVHTAVSLLHNTQLSSCCRFITSLHYQYCLYAVHIKVIVRLCQCIWSELLSFRHHANWGEPEQVKLNAQLTEI